MINDDRFIEEMKTIKRRLDLAANDIITNEYQSAGRHLINGYMEYHNLLKYFVADLKKYGIKEKKQ